MNFRQLLTITFFLIVAHLKSQTIVSGVVYDKSGKTIPGANIFLKDTYDGTSSDENGKFSFMTEEKGVQEIVVKSLGYSDYHHKDTVKRFRNVTIRLRESVNTLDAVVITAGTFNAADNSKVAALKPLDVVTTASSAGDFVAALQTLPGTQTVGESGRLFVRGGDSRESQVFIDGMRVFSPFTPSAKNTPARGRYSPFLFKGISFSTGGYSAEYGQALSGVLLLNTNDEEIKERSDISLMTVGGGLGKTKIWGENSLSVNLSYIDLSPYETLVPDSFEWTDPYRSALGEAVYRHKTKNGMLKLYSGFDYTYFDMKTDDINYDEKVRLKKRDNNFYLNSSYTGKLSEDWSMFTGTSVSVNNSDNTFESKLISNEGKNSHMKMKFKNFSNERFHIGFGAETFLNKIDNKVKVGDMFNDKQNKSYNLTALFSEADFFFSKNTAGKIGVRSEYNNYTDKINLLPRVSLAQKLDVYGQLSLAYGKFSQIPNDRYIIQNSNLKEEKTDHYILNYTYLGKGRTARFELYYKDYNDLIKYKSNNKYDYSNATNKGSGYAKGIDIFWRDNKSVKYLEYWLSYSWMDTKREYLYYPESATPSFASEHNLNIVAKYWIPQINTQLGAAYTFASGRPYHNPNRDGFMQGKTKTYNDLSLNLSWLITQQKIFYVSISNVLGANNVFGYEYASNPASNGIYRSKKITPSAKRFYFVGLFITLSADKKTNQMDNL